MERLEGSCECIWGPSRRMRLIFLRLDSLTNWQKEEIYANSTSRHTHTKWERPTNMKNSRKPLLLLTLHNPEKNPRKPLLLLTLHNPWKRQCLASTRSSMIREVTKKIIIIKRADGWTAYVLWRSAGRDPSLTLLHEHECLEVNAHTQLEQLQDHMKE